MDSDTDSSTSAQDKVTMTGRFRLFPLAPLHPPEPPRESSLDFLPAPLQPTEPLHTPEPPPKKEYKLIPEPPDTEFRKEFPPDPTIGSELDEAARVWKVYRKEAKAFDDMLLDGWSTTLDILLIFVSTVIMVRVGLTKIVPEAGLFSAVATAFVIESYQFLQPDNVAYAAAALYILVTASNHSTGMTLPAPPDLAYKSSISRWINGLWFTSILLSLAVALLSILAKQWITEYRARNNASAKSPKDWVLRREVYFQALNSWHIAEVVAILPFLLHLSLFLFFAGVVAFLWSLDEAIGIWIIFLGGFLAVFYIGCTLAPLWRPECPTSTPLSRQMRTSALALVQAGFTILAAALRAVQRILRSMASNRSFQRVMVTFRDSLKRLLLHLAESLSITTRLPPCLQQDPSHPSTMGDVVINVDPLNRSEQDNTGNESRGILTRLDKAVEHLSEIRADRSGIHHNLGQRRDILEAAALHWLIVEVSDSDAVAVALQSLGAFHWNSPVVNILRTYDRLVDVPDEIVFTRSSSGHTSSEVLRVIRSALCMRRHGQRVETWRRIYSLTQGKYADYPDLGLLCASPKSLALNVAAWREASPSLTSTALHAIRGDDSDLTLAYLLYCDLAQFSDDDWNHALDAAPDDVAVNLIPQFAKPFCLAVIVGGHFSWEDHPWVDPLLRRMLECVCKPNTDFPDSYNPLPSSTLDLLSSPRFLEAIPDESIPTILSYFAYNLDSATEKPTAESIVHFWAAFALACVARRMRISDYPSNGDVVFLRTCTSTLRTWRGSDGIRTGILNAILFPPRVARSISQSIWERLRVRDQYVFEWVLELADALAVSLCISVRVRENPIQTAGCIDGFFAYSELFMVGILPFIRETEHDRFVHLMQHCEELRPRWLDGHDIHFDVSRSAFLSQIHEEAARRGRCLACPEYLDYPPVPPGSVA